MGMNTYKCTECGDILESQWSDEEAESEFVKAKSEFIKLYPGKTMDNISIICYDCYQKIMIWREKNESGSMLQ